MLGAGHRSPHQMIPARSNEEQRPEQDRRIEQHDRDDVDPPFVVGVGGVCEERPEHRRDGNGGEATPKRTTEPAAPQIARRLTATKQTDQMTESTSLKCPGEPCTLLAVALSRATTAVRTIKPLIENLKPWGSWRDEGTSSGSRESRIPNARTTSKETTVRAIATVGMSTNSCPSAMSRAASRHAAPITNPSRRYHDHQGEKDGPYAQQTDLREGDDEQRYEEDMLETEGRVDLDGGQDGRKEPENKVGGHQPAEPPTVPHDRFSAPIPTEVRARSAADRAAPSSVGPAPRSERPQSRTAAGSPSPPHSSSNFPTSVERGWPWSFLRGTG